MYKGYQFQLFSNDWGINSGFKSLADKLHELLPLQGKVSNSRSKNKNLELFRKAQNAAYDLFNNGLCNRRGQFKNIFGFAPTQKDVYYSNKNTWTHWEDMVEEIMTSIIQAAAKEQGIK